MLASQERLQACRPTEAKSSRSARATAPTPGAESAGGGGDTGLHPGGRAPNPAPTAGPASPSLPGAVGVHPLLQPGAQGHRLSSAEDAARAPISARLVSRFAGEPSPRGEAPPRRAWVAPPWGPPSPPGPSGSAREKPARGARPLSRPPPPPAWPPLRTRRRGAAEALPSEPRGASSVRAGGREGEREPSSHEKHRRGPGASSVRAGRRAGTELARQHRLTPHTARRRGGLPALDAAAVTGVSSSRPARSTPQTQVSKNQKVIAPPHIHNLPETCYPHPLSRPHPPPHPPTNLEFLQPLGAFDFSAQLEHASSTPSRRL